MSSDDTRKAVTFFWPDPMTPVNVLDSSLIRYAFGERERSLGNVSQRSGTEETEEGSCDDETGGCANNENG